LHIRIGKKPEVKEILQQQYLSNS